MTRKECLDKAAECVLHDRANDYGGPEDNFGRIARLWSDYIGVKLDGIDVAMMMALLKVARIRNNKSYEDGYIDLAGYAACGAELAGAEKAREDATLRWGAEYKKLRAEAEGNAKAEDCEDVKSADVVVLWKHKPKAESGCCQNGNNQPEEPEYEPHERVQVRYAPGHWCGAEYICRASQWGHVVFVPGEKEEQTFRNEDVRKWHKAEGCEALVEHDAPQTKEELFNRIVDCNPATYGRPRIPTGEELAEMAEEEGR